MPNPANSFTDIRLSIDIEENPIDLSLKVYDVTGRLVMTKAYSGMTNDAFSDRLDVSNLDRGMYFVRITGSNGMLETYKLMKE